jgi:hypothetical protein
MEGELFVLSEQAAKGLQSPGVSALSVFYIGHNRASSFSAAPNHHFFEHPRQQVMASKFVVHLDEHLNGRAM